MSLVFSHVFLVTFAVLCLKRSQRVGSGTGLTYFSPGLRPNGIGRSKLPARAPQDHQSIASRGITHRQSRRACRAARASRHSAPSRRRSRQCAPRREIARAPSRTSVSMHRSDPCVSRATTSKHLPPTHSNLPHPIHCQLTSASSVLSVAS
jgi:hypothetical protein